MVGSRLYKRSFCFSCLSCFSCLRCLLHVSIRQLALAEEQAGVHYMHFQKPLQPEYSHLREAYQELDLESSPAHFECHRQRCLHSHSPHRNSIAQPHNGIHKGCHCLPLLLSPSHKRNGPGIRLPVCL